MQVSFSKNKSLHGCDETFPVFSHPLIFWFHLASVIRRFF
jgi:hypothetical protein